MVLLRNARASELVAECGAKRLAGARKAGHDGPHGYAHDIGYLSVRQVLQLAEHEQFAITIRHVPHRLFDHPDIVGLK
jgi:hypothetical protein